MKIEVTQEDIDAGRRVSPNGCPVALAIARAFKINNSDYVCVGVNDVYVNHELLLLPNSCAPFITAFDKKQPVQPFTFELELSV